MHDAVIPISSLTSNIVYPREVFQPALERGAAVIIIAHNHPSSRLEPTAADIQVAEQLMAASEVLGIELLEQLVISATKHSSVIDCIARDCRA